MRDQMHLHTFNVTDVICLVIHFFIEYGTGTILYGLSNDIRHLKM